MSKEQHPHALGNASLRLGITSAALVFSSGLCALTGGTQKWIQLVGTPLFVCGSSSAFLGLLGAILGLEGLFGIDRHRAIAPVNTSGGEDSPFLLPDSQTLYFFFTPDVSIPTEKQLFDGVTVP